MIVAFYVAGAVAVASTAMAISRVNAIHALLYLIVSLLSVAIVFYTLGAPFVAALEVIIYAGAIMVLFLFVIMMLNLGQVSIEQERSLLSPGIWAGPAVLAAVLIGLLVHILSFPPADAPDPRGVSPKELGLALYGPYMLGVLLASFLLLAGLVGAYHLGRHERKEV
jgi:NADH-quinone oxidoreductase subunit J